MYTLWATGCAQGRAPHLATGLAVADGPFASLGFSFAAAPAGITGQSWALHILLPPPPGYKRGEAYTRAYLAGSYTFKVAEYEVFRIVDRG